MDAEEDAALRRTAPMANLDVVPHAAYFHPADVHTTAVTRNWRWLFAAGNEGVVHKLDFFASLNGRSSLSVQQRHGLVETLNKAAVQVSHWENDTPRSPVVGNSRQQYAPITCSAVHSDGLWMLTGQKLNTVPDKASVPEVPVKLWTVRIYEGRCMHEFKHHRSTVSAVALEHSEHGFVSGSWDKTLQRCDLNTGQVTRTFLAHTSNVTTVAFTPWAASTTTLLSTALDGVAYCWDMRQERPTRTFQLAGLGHPPWIVSACWSANGDDVYLGRRNGTVDEWSVSKGSYSRTLKLPSGAGAVSALAAFPDGRHLFVSAEDNVRIWNVADVAPKGASPFQIVPAHSGAVVSSVCIDDSMRYMATSSGDRDLAGTSDRMTILYEIRPPAAG